MRKGQFIRKINPMDNGECSSLIRYRNYEQKYIDKYLNQFYSHYIDTYTANLLISIKQYDTSAIAHIKWN